MAGPDRYYEEELNYLLEAGREYARMHPERARYLNLRDPRARDPHVERLVESFAFLTGRVRQRLDDDFPELTHGLLDLIFPHYLKPIPSLALLEFRPIPGMLRERQIIPKGFLVDSKPTSAGVACRFSTAYPVEIHPLVLEAAGVHADDAGQRSIRLTLSVLEGGDASKLDVARLRVCISGEPGEAFALFRVIRQTLKDVVLHFSRDRRRVLPPSCVRPVGLAEEDSVLQYPGVSFPGYRLLSEYFAFPEKFLFFDILGLGPLELDKGAKSVELELRFSARLPDKVRPTRDSFRLYATPVINLFPRDGEPIVVTQLKTRYRVLGDYTHPDAYEVISVDGVEGVRGADGARREHHPFYSFTGPSHDSRDEVTFFHTHSGRSPSGAWVTYLSLVQPTRGRLPGEETLSLQLTCMNGPLCREVGIEDVRVGAVKRLDFATFRNFTRPTAPLYPRLGEGSEWRFVSHLALNFQSLAAPGALSSLLYLYDPGGQQANQRRIDAIRRVTASPSERVMGGVAVRGTRLEVELDEGGFDDEGDLLLFVQVLSEFVSIYAETNSFAELVVLRHPSGEVLRCPPAVGKQALL
ncbi:MAG: type VI secretion system baseplate subunit TssF [Thermoanaerobaculaceae bacterium]